MAPGTAVASSVPVALAAPAAGDRGAMTLFGRNTEHHSLFAEHIADSETYVITEGLGRTVHEWRPKPSKPDNHWLDCLVGCAVAASMQGCVTAEMSVRPKREMKRTKFSALVGAIR